MQFNESALDDLIWRLVKARMSSSLPAEGKQKRMLILKGGEFIATEALSVNSLQGLMGMARRRPLLLNGLELRAHDFARLIEEAERTGHPVWPQISNSEMAFSA